MSAGFPCAANIAIGLALLTKEVISFHSSWNFIWGYHLHHCGRIPSMAVIETTFGVMIDKMGENASILLSWRCLVHWWR